MKEKLVMVVDDEEQVREVFKTALESEGFKVVTAPTAEEALDILKTKNVNVFFLDLNLPGMNGLELCKLIRRDNPIAFIFAVTGYGSIFELVECREVGFDDYFKKPVDLRLLVEAAKESFNKLERWTGTKK
ncbi:MAG: response regulator [Candidatus Neomarinimicrobiota bacterium]|nr:response regulator [Candidatus Neomarinimicrobiota bacterium]RKY50331.1 MAG: response regulator [Candidatus Neomarinimicrobiota bacterium]